MSNRQNIDRRTVLKTIGAGVAGGTVLTGVVSAEKENFGQGNGLGVFLNEEAELKDSPLWDGGIDNRMGESVVEVDVGALTSVNLPFEDAPPAGPLAYAPKVVKVSPGTTVRWTWVNSAIPHNVVSLVDDNGEQVLEPDGNPRFQSAFKDSGTFEQTFSERGNHLYYCTPHGAPFPVESPLFDGKVYNEFGMRGAVQVAGKSL